MTQQQMEVEEPDRSTVTDEGGDGWINPFTVCVLALAALVTIAKWVWGGLDAFFTPGAEILVAETTEDVIRALDLPEAERLAIGRAARARALAEHTGEHRAAALEGYMQEALRGAGDG